jgi:hypothetical protein
MGKTARPPITDDAPLYIRWTPDASIYTIELRLDLVAKIEAQVRLSKQSGTELGGFLLGTIADNAAPTLRIDDVEMIPVTTEDTTVFLPEPERFQPVRRVAEERRHKTEVIGIFRTHVRVGPMRPSLADRSILVESLQGNPFVLLLIRAQVPNLAAFFIAMSGQLPDEPSVREFAFSEQDFRALPEAPPGVRPSVTQHEQKRRAELGLYARLGALLFIAIGACVLMWSFATQSGPAGWFGSGAPLRLRIAPENELMRISWDKDATILSGASGATLIINDGARRSQVQLGMDDLRLGTVEYRSNSRSVQVQMTVNGRSGPLQPQAARFP